MCYAYSCRRVPDPHLGLTRRTAASCSLWYAAYLSTQQAFCRRPRLAIRRPVMRKPVGSAHSWSAPLWVLKGPLAFTGVSGAW